MILLREGVTEGRDVRGLTPWGKGRKECILATYHSVRSFPIKNQAVGLKQADKDVSSLYL